MHQFEFVIGGAALKAHTLLLGARKSCSPKAKQTTISDFGGEI